MTSSPRLKSLRFTSDKFNTCTFFHKSVQIRSLTLPYLENSTFESLADWYMPPKVLNKLTIPAVKNLIIRIFTECTMGPETIKLITRSSCPLQSLTFYTRPTTAVIESESLRVMFTVAPTLTSLCINDPTEHTLNFLASITRNRQECLVLPLLQSLSSTLDHSIKVAFQSRLQILTNKWTPALDAALDTIAWRWDRDGYLVYFPLNDSMFPALHRIQRIPDYSTQG